MEKMDRKRNRRGEGIREVIKKMKKREKSRRYMREKIEKGKRRGEETLSEEEAMKKIEEKKEAIRKRKQNIPHSNTQGRRGEREKARETRAAGVRERKAGVKAGFEAGVVRENWEQFLGHSCRSWEIDWHRTRERKRGWKLLT